MVWRLSGNGETWTIRDQEGPAGSGSSLQGNTGGLLTGIFSRLQVSDVSAKFCARRPQRLRGFGGQPLLHHITWWKRCWCSMSASSCGGV